MATGRRLYGTLGRLTGLFEVLESLQQGAAEATGFANGREITIRWNLRFRDLATKEFEAQSRGELGRGQQVRQCPETQIGMAVGQFLCELSLQMQAEQAGGYDDGERREWAVGLSKCQDFERESCFKCRLKWAEMDFAWRWRRKVASRTHSE